MEAGAFYAQLKRTLETEAGDVWTETVLEGERRGEKHLLTSGPEREEEKTARVQRAHQTRPQAGHLRGWTCVHAHYPSGKDAGIYSDCA